MAKKAKKMTEATKRMLRERKAAERASTGSAQKPSKKGKKPSKSLAKGASSIVGTAHGYTIKKAAKGASEAVRLSVLEHNQGVIVHGLTAIAQEVRLHRAALVGAGLLSMRGKAGR